MMKFVSEPHSRSSVSGVKCEHVSVARYLGWKGWKATENVDSEWVHWSKLQLKCSSVQMAELGSLFPKSGYSETNSLRGKQERTKRICSIKRLRLFLSPSSSIIHPSVYKIHCCQSRNSTLSIHQKLTPSDSVTKGNDGCVLKLWNWKTAISDFQTCLSGVDFKCRCVCCQQGVGPP